MTLKLTPRLLLYLLLISVFPLILLSVFTYVISARLLLQEAQIYNGELVVGESEQLDLILEQVESLIFNLAGVEEIRELLEADTTAPSDTFAVLSTQSRIGQILNAYSNIQGLVSIDIFTQSGAHYHVGDTLNIDNINPVARGALEAQVAASPTTIAWLGVEQNINTASSFGQVVAVGRFLTRLNRETLQQEVTAMLLVNYSVEALIERFSAVELGQDVQLLLIDNDHHLVVHPDPAQIGTIASPELVSQLVGEGGAFTTVYKGVSVAVSYTRSSKAGWIVVSLTPLSTLNAKAANIGLSTLSLLVVSLVIVAIVAGILNRDLVTPIRTITQRINALQGGKLGEEMALPEGGKDEIGDLVRGYNLLLHNEMEKARVEKEREALIIQLEEARRFAEENARLKTEFLSTMSHELRTPMNAIEGFTSIMLSKMGGVDYNDKTTHYLNRVQANSKRLLGLINDFLDLSRVESGRLELSYLPFAPLKLAERLQSQIGVLAESKGLTFAVEIDPNLPNPLYGDEEAIAKVVINLLSNAIKFTEKGTVALQMHSAGHQWRILVVDTGIGIPPHARDYIFEEFRQVDQTSQRKYGGTGLGLAIVQKYTRTMGGTVTVQSEVGEGSTFTVLLPAHTTPQQE